MSRNEFVDKNFHEMFGIVCSAWLAKHESGATFSQDITKYQGRVADLLGSFYDQLKPPPPAKAPPAATPAAGPPPPKRNGP